MPIRFQCQRCGQLLGIASRKAGTDVECPKCGAAQTVPSEEAAAAALAMTRSALQPEIDEESSSLMVYDDLTPIDFPGKPQTARRHESSAGQVDLARQRAEPAPEGMILYHRQTLYLQGVLFVTLSLAAFTAGYFIGRGDASLDLQQAYEEATRELVLVEGKVVYDPGSGVLAGDEGAVVIALPDGKLPEQTLSIEGIRPRDPPPADDHQSVQAIEDLGGAYARVNAEGVFSLVLPERGNYRLLIVSNQTSRPADDPIDELDQDEIQQYFFRAAALVNRHKYRWTQEEFHSGGDPVTQNFGLDGIEP